MGTSKHSIKNYYCSIDFFLSLYPNRWQKAFILISTGHFQKGIFNANWITQLVIAGLSQEICRWSLHWSYQCPNLLWGFTCVDVRCHGWVWWKGFQRPQLKVTNVTAQITWMESKVAVFNRGEETFGQTVAWVKKSYRCSADEGPHFVSCHFGEVFWVQWKSI